MSQPRPARLILTCRLCKHRESFDVLDEVRAKTEEEAKTEIAGRFLRAENEFFQGHWKQAHPDEAAEVGQHIAAVTRLVRVMDYHKHVLESRFDGAQEGSPEPPAA